MFLVHLFGPAQPVLDVIIIRLQFQAAAQHCDGLMITLKLHQGVAQRQPNSGIARIFLKRIITARHGRLPRGRQAGLAFDLG